MDLKELPKELRTLFTLAEVVADFLTDKAKELGMQGIEACRRANLAATFTQSAYLAMQVGAVHSHTAARFLAGARIAADRTELRLRRRLAVAIMRLCGTMSTNQIASVANYAVALST